MLRKPLIGISKTITPFYLFDHNPHSSSYGVHNLESVTIPPPPVITNTDYATFVGYSTIDLMANSNTVAPDWSNVSLARYTLRTQKIGDTFIPTVTQQSETRWLHSNYGLVATYAWGGLQKLTFKFPSSIDYNQPVPYSVDCPVVENRVHPNIMTMSDNLIIGSTVEEWQFSDSYIENSYEYDHCNIDYSLIKITNDGCEIPESYSPRARNFPIIKPLRWNSKNYLQSTGWNIWVYDNKNEIITDPHLLLFGFTESDVPNYADIFLRLTFTHKRTLYDNSIEYTKPESSIVLKTDNKEYVSNSLGIIGISSEEALYFILYPDDTYYFALYPDEESFGYPAVPLD